MLLWFTAAAIYSHAVGGVEPRLRD